MRKVSVFLYATFHTQVRSPLEKTQNENSLLTDLPNILIDSEHFLH